MSSAARMKVWLHSETGFPAVSLNSLLAAKMVKTRQRLNMTEFGLKFIRGFV
jgi:hypothetical protein